MTERPADGAPLQVTLANPRADRVKRVRSLAGRSARSRQRLFLAEGPGAAAAAVSRAPERVRDLYVGESAAERHAGVVAAARTAGVYVHLATDEVADAMSPDAQGIVAVVDEFADSLAELPAEVRLAIVLVDVRDPGNVGTIVRVADAAGADAVILAADCADPHSPKVVRASAGSVFHLPVVRGVSLAEAAAAMRERGATVVATDVRAAHALGDPTGPGSPEGLSRPTAWVLGNEARGLTADEIAEADETVKIPIFGAAESLNVASATSVIAYASALSCTSGDTKR